MKRFIIGGLAALFIGVTLTATFATPVAADWFHVLNTMGWKETKAEHYKVPASGIDVRVYEWDTLDAKHRCVMAFASKGPVGMQCFSN